MPLTNREYLPLLHVLKKLPAADRQILLLHLNDKSCSYVEHCITKVLKGKNKLSPELHDALKECVQSHQHDLIRILKTQSPTVKRRALAKVGGGFLSLLLGVGIPMLLSLLKK